MFIKTTTSKQLFQIFLVLIFLMGSLSANEAPIEHKLRLSFTLLQKNFSLINRTSVDLQRNEWMLELANSAVSQTLKHYPHHLEFKLASIRTLYVEGNYYLRTERFNQSTQKLLLAKKLCEEGFQQLDQKTSSEICHELAEVDPTLPSLYSLVLHHLGQIPVYDQHSSFDMADAEHYLKLATEIRERIDESPKLLDVPDNNQEVGDRVVFLCALGYVYLQTDRLDKALEIYTQLAENRHPFNQLMTNRQLLKIYQKLGRYPEAMNSAHICLKMINDEIGRYTRVGSVYRDIGNLYYDINNPHRDPVESQRILTQAKRHCPEKLKYTAQTVREELHNLLTLLARCELLEAEQLRTENTKVECVDSLRLLEDSLSHLKSYETFGDLHLKQNSFVTASAFYSNGISLAKTLPNQEDVIENLQRKLFEIELRFLHQIGHNGSHDSLNSYLNKTKLYQQTLTSLRDKTLNQLRSDVPTEEIYSFVSSGYQRLITQMIHDLIAVLGPTPHSDYAVIGYGSVGRGIPSPYSDLEFGILVKNEENKEYFRNLSYLFHLRVNALCEAPICHFNIEELDWIQEEDCPSGRGFMLDPWDVIPYTCFNETYELIGTPSRLARVFAKDNHELNLAKTTTFYTHRFILGNETLVTDYQKEIDKNLRNTRDLFVQNYINYNLSHYSHHLGVWLEQNDHYSLKRDFYRPLTLMIDAFAVKKGMHSATPWQVIDRLYQDRDIDWKLHHDFLKLLEKVGQARLEAFSTYQRQHHAIYPQNQKDPQKYQEREETLEKMVDILITFQQKALRST